MDTIVVLDFGGQYVNLIGRRVRENNVYSEVFPCDVGPSRLFKLENDRQVRGIIFSGGPSSVYDKKAPRCNPEILEVGVPILGICYGHQLIADMVGGRVRPAEKKEYGIIRPKVRKAEGILEGIVGRENGWTSHGDTVQELPPDFQVLASTKNCPVAAFSHDKKDIYGIQWHPEVTHTERGGQIFKNFLFGICGCNPTWNMENFVKNAVESIKEEVGDRRCIIAMSGGIDSSTAAVLASKAIGENLTAVFVDHGFMRKDEPEKVRRIFQAFDIDFVFIDARKRFFNKLEGVTDPEEKRNIIGREFIRAFEEVAEEIDADYLIQGTVYSDWIESGSEDKSDLIKSHHNVGGLPSELDFQGIVEPLRDLYKDEVRKVAETIGMSPDIINRQPFPGPGLAVRMVGEVTPEKLSVLKRADEIFRKEVEKAGLDDDLWQYFAVLPGTQSTGVKGDARDYGYTIALRAVESEEAMTASFAKISYDFLEKVSTRITNEIPEATRVVYDVTHKPPATIEWE